MWENITHSNQGSFMLAFKLMHFTPQSAWDNCDDALRVLTHRLVCLSLNQIAVYNFESFVIWGWFGFNLHIILGTKKQKHFVWRERRAESVLVILLSRHTVFRVAFHESLSHCNPTVLEFAWNWPETPCPKEPHWGGKKCTRVWLKQTKLCTIYMKVPLDTFWSYSCIRLLAQPEMKHDIAYNIKGAPETGKVPMFHIYSSHRLAFKLNAK